MGRPGGGRRQDRATRLVAGIHWHVTSWRHQEEKFDQSILPGAVPPDEIRMSSDFAEPRSGLSVGPMGL